MPNKSLTKLVKRAKTTKPRKFSLPSKIRSYADKSRLEQMSNQELLATAGILAAEYKRVEEWPTNRQGRLETLGAIQTIIVYIKQLLEQRAAAKKEPSADG